LLYPAELRAQNEHRHIPRLATNESNWRNLSKAGWSLGCVPAVDSEGRTIWIADAHRNNGKRFVVRADERLTAFIELELTIRSFLVKKCKVRLNPDADGHRKARACLVDQ